ncbi:MAG: hypothetical protein KIT09_31350 [Bryobacteraceae bacterium]|nr:hypothetical protein [Bryobacteraceae bacterium]
MTHRFLICAVVAGSLFAKAPVITELQPRGAERGRPFTLTIAGRYIPDGARVWSTMPASFTALSASDAASRMMAPGREAKFLVEPAADLAPGIYPIRLETPDGVSNVLLFSVGLFPEHFEEESGRYSQPNRNDTIETAESVPSTPITVNGTLVGAERDIYRVYGKGGERRVFEVEARRCGSAVDPVLRILDGAGQQLAISDDALLAGLDPRIEFTFPREAYYYVEVHDARFSRQAQNFYRLKMGSYSYPDNVFPLGGRRGEVAEVTFSGGNLAAPVKAAIDLRNVPENATVTTIAAPDSPVAPFAFAVGDLPEAREPVEILPVPGVVNGRLSEPGEIDRYRIKVEPGDKLLIELQARELGTSRLEAIVTAYDSEGKRIDSAGDQPLPEDVFAVQGVSRTSTDPFLNLTVPKDAREIAIAVEDLALRGGPQYAYRLAVRKQAEDFQLTIASPYVNVPSGGTAVVVVAADRRGYDGPIQLSIPDLPEGIRLEGGLIPREHVDANNARTMSRRGMLILSADPGVELPLRPLTVWGEGALEDGTKLRRRARGVGMSVEVAGATAQGVVDRQRSLIAPWLGLDLPAGPTAAPPANLEVKQVKLTRMEEGDRFDFEYAWKLRSRDAQLPDELGVDVVGARDIRITAFQKNGETGSFSINTTKATDPARYDVIVRGRIKADGLDEDIYARPLVLTVTEQEANVQVSSNH